MRKIWTKEEEKLIQDHYPDINWLSNELGRSITSIRHRISRMGLAKRITRKWSAEEENLLKITYPNLEISRNTLAEMFGRSVKAIHGQRRYYLKRGRDLRG